MHSSLGNKSETPPQKKKSNKEIYLCSYSYTSNMIANTLDYILYLKGAIEGDQKVKIALVFREVFNELSIDT